MLHYFAREFYASEHVSLALTDNRTARIYGVSDHRDITGTLVVAGWSWSSKTLGQWEQRHVSIPRFSGALLWSGSISDALSRAGCSSFLDCFLTLELFSGSYPSSASLPIAQNWFVPASFKDIQLPDPHLRVLQVTSQDGRMDVTFKAAAASPFTWLETTIPGRWSRNGFIALAGASSSLSIACE